MKTPHIELRILLVISLLQACDDAGAEPQDASADAEQQSAHTFAGCVRGTLEPDFGAAPLSGPAVQDGELTAGDYVLSATYLQVKPEARARFDELIGPIMADLAQRPGLLGLSLGLSASCGTARTLSVWRDESAMFEFAAGEAHAAAVRAVSEVSRGGSVVTHWTGDAQSATWSRAAEQLGADDGPSY